MPEYLRSLLLAEVDRLVAEATTGGWTQECLVHVHAQVIRDCDVFKFALEGDHTFAVWAEQQTPRVNARPHSDAGWQQVLVPAFDLFKSSATSLTPAQNVRCACCSARVPAKLYPERVVRMRAHWLSHCEYA